MATLHGFPVVLSGRRLCIVDMPDCWAIMNSLDAFPQASFRFPKDEAGWRDAVAQLQRSDAPEPVAKRASFVAGQTVVTNPRRQFSVARIGIFLTAAVLAASTRMPWAVVRHDGLVYKGDLFVFMDHGWRHTMVWALIVLAGVCAVLAMVLPFRRVRFTGSLCGVLALLPVLFGFTQIHTYDPAGLSNPPVAVGYGAFVALGACAVLIMSWAVFPAKMRRAPLTTTDHLGEYGVVSSIPLPGGGLGPPVAMTAAVVAPGGPTVAGTSDGGQPAPAAGRYVKQPDGPPGQPGGPSHFTGLPTLGVALTELAQREQAERAGGQAGYTDPAAGSNGSDRVTPTWVPPTANSSIPMPTAVAPTPARPTAPVPPGGTSPVPATANPAHPGGPPAVQPAGAAAPSLPASGHPPGWYADYADGRSLRWWDGSGWTEHTHPAA
jgi:multidrug transporter EmrE-like cation transporter